jgi:hypothetical protein
MLKDSCIGFSGRNRGRNPLPVKDDTKWAYQGACAVEDYLENLRNSVYKQ